jgi:hypothetical protein
VTSQPGTPRVRVTGPPRGQRSLNRPVDLEQDTRLAGVYLSSLLREQLWLALRLLGILAVAVGLLPALFALVPQLADVRVLGVPLAWLVVGVAVYPLLLGLGWLYVRRAERNEDAFTDLMGARPDEPAPEQP